MKNRSQLTREELLAEIEFAEAILDGCGADEGLTLWGRIASIKGRLTPLAPDSLKAGDLSLPESVKVENALPAISG